LFPGTWKATAFSTAIYDSEPEPINSLQEKP
jgi:hypothetical protein